MEELQSKMRVLLNRWVASMAEAANGIFKHSYTYNYVALRQGYYAVLRFPDTVIPALTTLCLPLKKLLADSLRATLWTSSSMR
jgi:hypothetical protein